MNAGNACPKLHAPWETFVDGELPAPQMLELQTHLDVCEECSGEVALSRAIRDGTRRAVLGGDSSRTSARRSARSSCADWRASGYPAPARWRSPRQRWRCCGCA
jgi:anti-sigma factor RsiW